jgi:hypothetical protein
VVADLETQVTAQRMRAVCFDWGGTLMAEDGPPDLPMAL